MKNLSSILFVAILVGAFVIPVARTQTTSGQSNYIFRYNTGISSVFLSMMTFTREQPLNLGTCTTDEKINGPLSCALNCNNDSVCLLEVSGPSGANVNDVIEIVSETPITGASPAPAGSPSPGNPTNFNTLQGAGNWFHGSGRAASPVERRVEAYNAVTDS